MCPTVTKRSRLLLLIVCVLLGIGVPARTPQALPAMQRTVLPNGLVLLVSEEHSLPMVTCQLLVDAGSWRDPQGEEGLAYLTAHGLLLGTAQRTVTAMREGLDFVGASLAATASRDYATLSLQVLTQHLDQGLDIVLDALTQPTFPAQELRQEVARIQAALQAAEDQPREVAMKAFHKALFGSGPYGHPTEGTPASLPALTREAVEHFYRAYYHPNNTIIAVVGDTTSQDIQAKLLPRLAAWPTREISATPVEPTFAPGPETIKIERAITQATIILGQASIRRANPDFYALTVMNYLLGGGGFASRLMEEIRDKRGLAYAVTSFLEPGKYPGSFQIMLQTKNASAREAIALAQQQMERMRTDMVSEQELEGAKQYLIGNFPLRLTTQTQVVQFLARGEYYGLGEDYLTRYPSLIQAVTREEVLRVARAYLHPEHRILVVVAHLPDTGLD